MGKYKDSPRYNVVSIRVSDEEKEFLDSISRRDQTTITNLMRDAMLSYFNQLTSFQEQR
jgi:predicted DNA-binding protein